MLVAGGTWPCATASIAPPAKLATTARNAAAQSDINKRNFLEVSITRSPPYFRDGYQDVGLATVNTGVGDPVAFLAHPYLEPVGAGKP